MDDSPLLKDLHDLLRDVTEDEVRAWFEAQIQIADLEDMFNRPSRAF